MIIKNFKLFKESLLTKLEGPTEEEIFKTYNSTDYDDLLLHYVDKKSYIHRDYIGDTDYTDKED